MILVSDNIGCVLAVLEWLTKGVLASEWDEWLGDSSLASPLITRCGLALLRMVKK